jgi:hypothetical protein
MNTGPGFSTDESGPAWSPVITDRNQLTAMSQHSVSLIIHALLTDESLRDRFSLAPMDVLVDLHLWTDIELTLDEAEAFVRASRDVWRPTEPLTHARVH